MTDSINAFVPGPRIRIDGAATGPLAGLSFAAKDLFDVAGVPTGGGNHDWARANPVPTRHAWAVQTLLDAGATLIGKTITDEVSLGILGENAFDGTPVNVRARDRVPGGSSSGSAAAVADGQLDPVAVANLERAADAGELFAQAALGTIVYALGVGTAENWERAAPYARLAAQTRVPLAIGEHAVTRCFEELAAFVRGAWGQRDEVLDEYRRLRTSYAVEVVLPDGALRCCRIGFGEQPEFLSGTVVPEADVVHSIAASALFTWQGHHKSYFYLRGFSRKRSSAGPSSLAHLPKPAAGLTRASVVLVIVVVWVRRGGFWHSGAGFSTLGRRHAFGKLHAGTGCSALGYAGLKWFHCAVHTRMESATTKKPLTHCPLDRPL